MNGGDTMPQAGDTIIATLNRASLEWGTFRTKNTRNRIAGERYIPISRSDARRVRLYNSNYRNELGVNIFNAVSTDGIFRGQIKAAGCSKANDIFAKQLQGNGNLKALEPWLTLCRARPGDQIMITWVTTTDIKLTFIPQRVY